MVSACRACVIFCLEVVISPTVCLLFEYKLSEPCMSCLPLQSTLTLLPERLSDEFVFFIHRTRFLRVPVIAAVFDLFLSVRSFTPGGEFCGRGGGRIVKDENATHAYVLRVFHTPSFPHTPPPFLPRICGSGRDTVVAMCIFRGARLTLRPLKNATTDGSTRPCPSYVTTAVIHAFLFRTRWSHLAHVYMHKSPDLPTRWVTPHGLNARQFFCLYAMRFCSFYPQHCCRLVYLSEPRWCQVSCSLERPVLHTIKLLAE